VFRVKAWARGLVWIRHWPSNSLFLFSERKEKCLAKKKREEGVAFCNPSVLFLELQELLSLPKRKKGLVVSQ